MASDEDEVLGEDVEEEGELEENAIAPCGVSSCADL